MKSIKEKNQEEMAETLKLIKQVTSSILDKSNVVKKAHVTRVTH